MWYYAHSFSNEYKSFIRYVFYAVAVILTILTVLTAIALCDISRMSAYTYDSISKIPHNRTGLVLGTSKYLINGGLNEFFVNRIQAATELYKAGKIDYIVVSGDNAHRSYNEPRLMRRELIAHGIPRDRIYLDYAGFRTLDSVVRASRIFRQNHITIISQDFHNERAIYIARHFGIDAIGYNARQASSSFFTENIREIIARLRCILDIYILNSKPRFLGETIEIGNSSIDPKHAQLHTPTLELSVPNEPVAEKSELKALAPSSKDVAQELAPPKDPDELKRYQDNKSQLSPLQEN